MSKVCKLWRIGFRERYDERKVRKEEEKRLHTTTT